MPWYANERHPGVKITNLAVALIREMYATGDFSVRELAEEFELGKSQVHRIVRGEQRALANDPAEYDEV